MNVELASGIFEVVRDGGFLSHRNHLVYSSLRIRSLQVFLPKNEPKQAHQGFFWLQHQVFVPHDVKWVTLSLKEV